jgi:hypothetical protein
VAHVTPLFQKEGIIMNEQKQTRIRRILNVLALALVIYLASMIGVTVGAQRGIYRTGGGAKLVVPSGSTVEVQSGGALDILSGATFTATGTTVLTGSTTLSSTTLSKDLSLTAQTAFSVTAMGIPITPTGAYQPIESVTFTAGGGTADIAPGTTNGDILTLLNINATQVITVDGTGSNVECKADVPMGARDTLMLIWDGSDWRCLSSYDNS